MKTTKQTLENMNQQAVSAKRTFLQIILWRLRRFLTVPRLYVNVLEKNNELISNWTISKSPVEAMLNTFKLQDEIKGGKIIAEIDIGLWPLLKMLFFSFFSK